MIAEFPTPTPSPVQLALARRELALEKRKLLLRKENEIEFYEPHEKQIAFHAAADYHYRYARTGNRFGKSEMGAAEDVAFALGYRPWLAEDDPARTLGIPPHPTKGVILTADWDKSTEVFTEREGENLGKLFKYIPKSACGACTRNHSGAIDRILVKHISGGWSEIRLDTVKSYKQNPLGFESSAWDWIHIDEPISEGMWKAVVRGLIDRGGRAWFTCTPLSEPWIDVMFIPDLEDQSNVRELVQHGDFWMMVGSTDDNPHNRAEDVERVMALYTEEERETRRTGIPRAYSGLVYKEFKWEVHVRKEPPTGWSSWTSPPTACCIYIANDYHFRKNNANLFIAVPPDGPAVVFHEIWKQLLVEEEVAEIRAVLNGRPYQPIIMDPLASTPNKVNELTAMDEYRKLGLAVLPATKDPVNGIRAVKSLFKARDKKGGPCIIISNECRRFLFEVSRGFVWDGEDNKPVKQNDDMMECLYRLVLQGLVYVEPASLQDYSPVHLADLPDNVLDFPETSLTSWSDDEEKTKKNQRYTQRYRV